MSLPDTVFIFVLALIIFGPKKLPEIGRQLGRLVGEFRRASDEFKYQIEEELRQVELAADDKKAAESAALAETSEASGDYNSASSTEDEFSADPASSIPVGQYPNIDAIDTTGLHPPDTSDSTYDEMADGQSGQPAEAAAEPYGSQSWDGESWESEAEAYDGTAAENESAPADAAHDGIDTSTSDRNATGANTEMPDAEGVLIPFEKPPVKQAGSVNGSNLAETKHSAPLHPVPAVDSEIAHG